ncbi:iron-containing alcohol dehydrogenase [Acetobacter orleanensis]|uniref:Alcohol dehydrogenase 2 n=1 Tax=Acetobacter orleanensis TaxID=104099 RepID=A0A4Y3TMH7_9PROT|nr:iron-containing alcohol dehydrogenase [Acetobacter orleanensis]KXV65742.1 alcohol dehydrogenase [Acetobacter orleanensis]PCD78638.1 alcohol dehydrogenase [Acetobacter orleanensis]GAN67297.1 alcohol dehydrogenase iron-containing [Acetobacter orleanensis JCM 7639]GBR23891.1 alcohol dehydrogenase [Acetobacter orleanensis NRIC 0473]GEB83556.1 alcohol dehydrogenase [Acetobacter orleanensis]
MTALYLPSLVRIGGGALNELPAALKQAGLSAPFIITDAFMAQSGLLDRVKALLAGAGFRSGAFPNAVPDPTVASVEAALAALKQGEYDCVIGLGGGSPIDTAKMVAVLAKHGGTPSQLKVPHVQDDAGLPIIAIPTTAGTGSEATRVTVITDEKTDEKMLCAGYAYLPHIAIVDYELTLTMPRRLTADTGLDALTHALEAYVSRLASPFTDALALAAMRRIWHALPVVCAEPSNREARAQVMQGAFEAGMAFSNASVALVHGMSRPIGAHFHVAHGLSNAMLLPEITAWSVTGAEARYATCARVMGIVSEKTDDHTACEALVIALRLRNRELDVPTPQSYGLEEGRWNDLLPLMAEQALASGSPANNPRVPAHAEIVALYRKVWA